MALKVYLSDGTTEVTGLKSVSYHEAVNSDSNIRPGCVGSAYIEVVAFGTQANAVTAGQELICKYNGNTLGHFYAEPIITTKQTYRFTAYDSAAKLDVDFSEWLSANQTSFPMTIYALVSAACTVAGVTLGSASWPLSTQTVPAMYADNVTCRNILEYAAELACRFVRCDSSGQITFDWYTTNGTDSVHPGATQTGYVAYKQDGLNYENYTTTALDRVAVYPSGTDDAAYIYPSGVSSGNTLDITNNLLLTGADATLYNAVAQNVYTTMSALGTYRPMTVSVFPAENPFRAGQIISVTDSQSVSFTSVLTGMDVSQSEAILKSAGLKTYDGNGSNIEKTLVNLSSEIVRINKLKVDWAEIGQAIINTLESENITCKNLTVIDDDDNVIATFRGSAITLGETDKTHTEVDYHSLRLIDKEGNAYVYLSDLRDTAGEYDLSEDFAGNGTTKWFATLFPIKSGTETVTIDGVETSDYTVDDTTTEPIVSVVKFTTAPANESSIIVSYTTESHRVKAYTLGVRGSDVVGPYSYAMGYLCVASKYLASAEGRETTASGTYSHAEGYGSVASGQTSHAEGQRSTASGSISHAEGFNTVASAPYSHAEGVNTTAATGARSTCTSAHAEGTSTTATGDASHAEGSYTTASADYAHAEGFHTQALDIASHAEGSLTKAYGYSHAEGSNTTAGALSVSSMYAHAEGYSTEATGQASHAEGWDTAASGAYSHAQGLATIAAGDTQTAIGKYNVSDTTSALIIGNGTDNSNRSNAMTVDWNGNEVVAGYIRPNANGGSNLGTSSYHWGNVYTNAVNLNGSDLTNDIIGTASMGTTATTLKGAIRETHYATLLRSGVVPSGTNLSNLGSQGLYYLSGSATYTGLPTGVRYGTLVVYRPIADSSQFVVQTICSAGSTIYMRMVINDVWTTWSRLRTQDVDYETLTSGVLAMRAAISGGTKYLRCSTNPSSAMTSGTEYTIGTLSSTYRPTYLIVHYFLFNGSGGRAKLSITTDGVVKITPFENIATTAGFNLHFAYI